MSINQESSNQRHASSLFGPLSEDDQSYVRQLATMSISRLEKEPRLLHDEEERLQKETEDLAVHSYRSFVDTAACVSDVSASTNDMSARVQRVTEQLPKVAQACMHFTSHAVDIRAAQTVNRKMIEHQSQLLELLEIPTLMDSCVRNGLYEEALDLESYARTLATRHPDIPVIKQLSHEMAQTMSHIHTQLKQLLRGQIQLSMCLRAVAYLRRLGIYNEQELREEFLRCRTAWLQEALARIPNTGNSYEYLSKFLDTNRVSLFEIITQYNAIFVDEQPTGTETVAGLLYHWATVRVTHILHTIERVLPSVKEGSFLSSLLEQCMYCGLALSRVGADFRGLVPPIFEKHLITVFESHVKEALEAFAQSLNIHEWHLESKQLVKLGIPVEGSAGALIEYPPLACFANSVITAFNILRHRPPLTIKLAVTSALQTGVQQLANKLHQVKILAYSTPQPQTEDKLARLAKATVEHLLPYLERLCQEVFSDKKLHLETRRTAASLLLLYGEEERTVQPGSTTIATIASTTAVEQKSSAAPEFSTAGADIPVPTTTLPTELLSGTTGQITEVITASSVPSSSADAAISPPPASHSSGSASTVNLLDADSILAELDKQAGAPRPPSTTSQQTIPTMPMPRQSTPAGPSVDDLLKDF